MRILMLTHNMAGLGGSFMRAYSLARSLVQMEHEVTLIASRREPGLRPITGVLNGVRVFQTGDLLPRRLRHGGLSALDILGRMAFIKKVDYDLIHGFDHRFAVSFPALFAHRRQRIPFISDWSDLWGKDGIAGQRRPISRITLGLVDHFWESQTRRRADHLTVITHDLATRAEAIGVSQDKIHILPLVANTEQIRPLPKTAMRARYGLPTEGHILVHTGFSPYDIRLMACTFVILTRNNPAVRLVTTGGKFPEIERIFAKAGCADRFHALGILPYERLQEVMACGDVMILPFSNSSLNRARFPNSFADYLASGRAIVSNPTGDIGRVMQKHSIGSLVDESPEAFAAGVQQLLDQPGLREEMGRNARRLAETQFSSHAAGRMLCEIYESVLTSRPFRRA